MALSEELKTRIRNEFPKYPEKRAVLLSALHFVQEEQGGWIRPEVIPELGELLEIPAIDVKEVASFYAMFNEAEIGKRHLRVCTGLSCCLRGARGLQNRIESELGARPGELAEDGMFSIGLSGVPRFLWQRPGAPGEQSNLYRESCPRRCPGPARKPAPGDRGGRGGERLDVGRSKRGKAGAAAAAG